MTQLVRFDTNSLNRALVGFDKFFDDFENRFATQISQNYPPYNIIKTGENTYEIQVAVSGFDKEDISVEVDQNQLTIKGKSATPNEAVSRHYLYRGLSSRDFTRNWTLADHIQVETGNIKNGVLTIYLKRVIPDSLLPRKIKISGE
jgi:molecular chaperone IbpA